MPEAIGEIEEIQKNRASKYKPKSDINLLSETTKLAMAIDNNYSKKIKAIGEDLQKELNLQRKLLNIKGKLTKEKPSDEVISMLKDLQKEYNIDVLNEDPVALKENVDSHLERIKLSTNKQFSNLQTCNQERMMIISLASKMITSLNPNRKMVENQRVS